MDLILLLTAVSLHWSGAIPVTEDTCHVNVDEGEENRSVTNFSSKKKRKKKGCQVENYIGKKMSSEVFKNAFWDQNTSMYLYGLVRASQCQII